MYTAAKPQFTDIVEVIQLYYLIISQDKPFKLFTADWTINYKYEIDPNGFKGLVEETDSSRKYIRF